MSYVKRLSATTNIFCFSHRIHEESINSMKVDYSNRHDSKIEERTSPALKERSIYLQCGAMMYPMILP